MTDDAPDSQAVPDWDDEYVDRVSDRLMFNYDLEKDRQFEGEDFTLYGRMIVESKKQIGHPLLSVARHDATEHLFVTRRGGVSVADLERLVDLGESLADDWIDLVEEHYSTDFTFAVVAPSIPDDVRSFVADYSNRTLLKYGFYGHYEINFVAVAPDDEDIVASPNADVSRALALWDPVEERQPGLVGRFVRRLRS